MTNCTEARGLLERVGSIRARGEWHIRCLNGGYYGQETRPCACADLRAFLVGSPACDAAIAALVEALEERGFHAPDKCAIITGHAFPEGSRCEQCVDALAGTSPAAAALLAERDKLQRIVEEFMHSTRTGSPVNDYTLAEAAALAPGEEPIK